MQAQLEGPRFRREIEEMEAPVEIAIANPARNRIVINQSNYQNMLNERNNFTSLSVLIKLIIDKNKHVIGLLENGFAHKVDEYGLITAGKTMAIGLIGPVYIMATGATLTLTNTMLPILLILAAAGYAAKKLIDYQDYKTTKEDIEKIFAALNLQDKERQVRQVRQKNSSLEELDIHSCTMMKTTERTSEPTSKEWYAENYAVVKDLHRMIQYVKMNLIDRISKLTMDNKECKSDIKLNPFLKKCLNAVLNPNGLEYNAVVSAWNNDYKPIKSEINIVGIATENYISATISARLLREQIVSIISNCKIKFSEEYYGVESEEVAKLNAFLSIDTNKSYLVLLQITSYYLVDYAIKNNSMKEIDIEGKSQKFLTQILEDKAEDDKLRQCVIL